MMLFSRPRVLVAFWVLLLMFPSVSGFADTVDYTNFPFLALTSNQWQYMLLGFRLQWLLFGAFGSSSASAVYYLALTAALVGALMIVFNKKNQSPSTVGPWLFLVVALLFAPYNSRLFFYPVEGTSTCTSAGGSNVANIKACGFTPQVVAAHIGSTLNLLFYDIFKGQEYQDVISSYMAEQGLAADNFLGTPDQPVIDAFKNYAARCGDVMGGPQATDTTTTTPTTASQSYMTMGAAVALARNYYDKKPYNGMDKVTGPAIALYTSTSGMTDAQKTSYFQGVKSMYAMVHPELASNFSIGDSADSSKNVIALSVAVPEILQVMRAAQLPSGPGQSAFYFTSVSSPSASGPDASDAVAERRTNYYTTVGAASTTMDYATAKEAGNMGSFQWFVDRVRNNPEFAKMPVAQVNMVVKGSASGNRSVAAGSLTTSVDCSGDSSKAAYQTAMQNWMVKLGVNPDAVAFLWDDTKSPPCGAEGNKCGGANSFLTLLGKTGNTAYYGTDSFKPAQFTFFDRLAHILDSTNGDGAGVRQKVTKVLQQTSVATAADQQARAKMETAGSAGSSTLQANLMGNAGWMSQVVSGIGKAIGGIAGKLTGVYALAVIEVERYLIDMAIMVLLVVTPLMFIMGVMVPGYAMGILTTVVMGMMVLKLVPVTMIIIDTFGGLILQSIANSSSDGLDQFFLQGAVLYAIAGLYTSIIGLTLFVMFKIGDANANIKDMQTLDKAAGEVASAGYKVAKAAATVALAATGAGVAGAISTAGGPGALAAAKNAALNEGTNQIASAAGAGGPDSKAAEAVGEISALPEGQQPLEGAKGMAFDQNPVDDTGWDEYLKAEKDAEDAKKKAPLSDEEAAKYDENVVDEQSGAWEDYAKGKDVPKSGVLGKMADAAVGATKGELKKGAEDLADAGADGVTVDGSVGAPGQVGSTVGQKGLEANTKQKGWDGLSRMQRAGRGFVSGFYGAVQASGALSKIPILGEVMKEVGNEWTQAPIRAQAMYDAGGGQGTFSDLQAYRRQVRSNYKKGFYERELGAISGGQEYEDLERNGHLMSKFDNSRDSGKQAAAGVIKGYEGRRQAERTVRKDSQIEDFKIEMEDYLRTQLLSSIQNAMDLSKSSIVLKNGTLQLAAEGAPKDASMGSMVEAMRMVSGKAAMYNTMGFEKTVQSAEMFDIHSKMMNTKNDAEFMVEMADIGKRGSTRGTYQKAYMELLDKKEKSADRKLKFADIEVLKELQNFAAQAKYEETAAVELGKSAKAALGLSSMSAKTTEMKGESVKIMDPVTALADHFRSAASKVKVAGAQNIGSQLYFDLVKELQKIGPDTLKAKDEATKRGMYFTSDRYHAGVTGKVVDVVKTIAAAQPAGSDQAQVAQEIVKSFTLSKSSERSGVFDLDSADKDLEAWDREHRK